MAPSGVARKVDPLSAQPVKDNIDKTATMMANTPKK
jgi:hypothetical protein